MTTLTVVIPAFNEADGIAEIINRVLAVQGALKQVGVHTMELLVVDDGSVDDTAQIAQNIEGVNLIRHEINKGYGAALKTGFSAARGDLIGFLDADGTYPPEYFPALCEASLDGVDVVIGSRMAGSESQMPVTRRIGNIFFANLISLVGRRKVTDSASGMRVFKREVLDKLSPLPDGLNLTPVMSARALHEHIEMAEIPIPYSERIGRSKLSVIRDGSLFLRSIIWTVLDYNPVRILGLIGFGGMVVAGITAGALVAVRLSGITSLGAWGVAGLYVALVSSVTGISIFALGITFNYLVAFFHRRPIRQGLFNEPIFKQPLDKHFGWIGLVSFTLGMVIGIGSLALGIGGWEIARIWLYLLGSAMLILVGTHLVLYWILFRVLEVLSESGGILHQGTEN